MKNALLCISLVWISINGFAQTSSIIEKVIYFDSNSDSLTSASKAILDSLVMEIQNDSVVYYRIKSVGFTDSTGLEQNNLLLSKRRAEVVCSYIRVETNRKKDKEEVLNYGSQNPVASNSLPSGRSLNRRTVLTLELIKYVPPKPSNDTLFVDGGAMVIFPPGTLPYDFETIAFESRFYDRTLNCADCRITTITSTGECLSTAGMLFVSAAWGSFPVDSLAGEDSIIVRIPAEEFDPRMELFTAEKGADGNTTWKPINIALKYDAQGTRPYYEFKTRNLGGHNIDRIDLDLCVKAEPCKIKTQFLDEKIFLIYDDRDFNSVVATRLTKAKEYSGNIVKANEPTIVSVFKKGEAYYRVDALASKLKKHRRKNIYVIRKKNYYNARKVECPLFISEGR